MKPADSIAARARLGEPLDDVLVIDSHAHLGSWQQFPILNADGEGMRPAQDSIGVDVTCFSAIVSACGMDTAHGNDWVARTVKESAGRYWGYIVVNPSDPNGGRAEVERCKALGLRGLKIHTYHGKPYTHETYIEAFKIADEVGWPVLAHTWGKRDLGWMRELATQFKRAQWICAHTGSADLDEYLKIGRDLDNVYLELCTSSCPRGLVETVVAECGAHKFLYGSDIPFIGAPMQFGRVAFAQIGEDDKRRILGLNAKAVFGL